MDNQMYIERITPDTSILIEGVLSKKIEGQEYKIDELILHEAVLAELEHQANLGKAIGYLGLEELKKLRILSEKFDFKIRYGGQRPRAVEIKYASLGEIDSLIRTLAHDEDSTLITSDKVQYKVAEARGIKTIFIQAEDKIKPLKLEKLFDNTTMSVHLKEEVFPFAKKGVPGNWEFVQIRDKPFTQEEIQEMSTEIIENAKIRRDSFIEIERLGSTIIQLGSYRIVITKPPFSDGWEITAVRPVSKLNLDDYKLSQKLKERLEQAEGILIAGAPGMGKCHGKDTPILMYNGSIKMVQDIKIGDLIMGPDSKPRTVLSITDGYGKLYKIIPVKGNLYTVNENHILSLKHKDHYKEKTINICVKDFLKCPKHFRERCKTYRTRIEFPEKETTVDPYFLGLWLGDGVSASLRVSNSEVKILEFLNEYAQKNELLLKQHSYKEGICQTYAITTGKRGGMPTRNNVLNRMYELNLMNNKHIPDTYIINDYEVRLQILAGLIDTDGYLTSNCFEITTKYEKLKENILFLSRSLGFAAYSKEKIIKNKKYHRIRISGDISLIPTKVERKIGDVRRQNKNVLRTGIKIEEIGSGEYYGFELDSDGLYCLGDFTVTHNSTIAAALAEYYVSKGKIVKTVEAPRDLMLRDEITQYSLSHADAQEIQDILLLSRPDYTIFDEMRNTVDFKLFADLRLAGIGFAGVIHATNPIDAIQRFIGRVELGVIPQVIDTVIFIKNGMVNKVLSLKMTVKVPSGMTEADLARPLVVVSDFETGKAEFEIYSYGEETVVIPVNISENLNPARQLAAKSIEEELKRHVGNVKAEVIGDNKAIVYIPERDIARIIGKEGKNIEKIESKLGLHIDVRPLTEEPGQEKPVRFEMVETGKSIVIYVDEPNKPVDTYIDDVFLFTSTSSKKGEINVHKKSKLGKSLWNALNSKRKIEVKTTA